MSRYIGPRLRVMRAPGTDLPGLSPKVSERRPYPPGQRGQRRRKETEFGKRLKEKQKLHLNYGVISAQPKSKDVAPLLSALEAKRGWDTRWLTVDKEQRTATVNALPDEGAVLFPFEVQLVIEFYAQGS
jgi:ribosomal protein S4